MTIVETPRLGLRWFEETDGPALLAYQSDTETTRFLSPRPPMSVTVARAWAAGFAQSRGGSPNASMAFAIAIRDGDREDVIGEVTLTKVPLHRGHYLGFVLRRDTWGRGYATEAATGVLGYAFKVLRLERIRAGAHPDNAGSLRVLRKIGMTPQGKRWFFPHAPPGVSTQAFEIRRDVWLRWFGRTTWG